MHTHGTSWHSLAKRSKAKFGRSLKYVTCPCALIVWPEPGFPQKIWALAGKSGMHLAFLLMICPFASTITLEQSGAPTHRAWAPNIAFVGLLVTRPVTISARFPTMIRLDS